jgi:hypothetical protein
MPTKDYSDPKQIQQASPVGQTPATQQGPEPTSIILMSALPRPIPAAPDLNKKPRVTVAFPPCTDELLALINTTVSDDVTAHFLDYFKFGRHRVFGEPADGQEFSDSQLGAVLDPALVDCLPGGSTTTIPATNYPAPLRWPTKCCICAPCVRLWGDRNGAKATPLERLFIGDAVWLFYFERMGIFQILGAILDAYACNGRLPISNGSLPPPGIRDDVTALVLEVMVRQAKTGMSSSVRDRACTYRTSLGWVSDVGRKLQLDTVLNTGFNTLFHRFLFNALEFYRDKRLAEAIRTTAVPARASSSTLVTISETVDVLKRRFEAFDYGRNYYNTLSGIVWTIAGMSVIRELIGTLGIPSAYERPDEYIPAAYDLLVLKRPPTHGETNRYMLHRSCAENGRDILLDLEVLDHRDRSINGALDRWLAQIEGPVEAYRTAYRTLTGVDLGASEAPTIEQQA